MILLTGVVMVVFDTTIVNVAIDALARGLHTSVSTAQWTISGYVLALGMVVPVAGWASARFGAKQVWMGALTLFMVGSILSSVAWNIDALIVFRLLQGIGGGLMLPILQNLLVEAAGERKLGRIMSLISLPTLLGPILGTSRRRPDRQPPFVAMDLLGERPVLHRRPRAGVARTEAQHLRARARTST